MVIGSKISLLLGFILQLLGSSDMNPLVDGALTVFGGLLSALAGLIVATYQLRSQDKGTRQDWYARTVVLADQVEKTVERFNDNDGSKYSTARIMLTMSSQLREHASNVPDGIDTGIIKSLDKTAYYCESAVSATPDGSSQQEYQLSDPNLTEAKMKAEELSSSADDLPNCSSVSELCITQTRLCGCE